MTSSGAKGAPLFQQFGSFKEKQYFNLEVFPCSAARDPCELCSYHLVIYVQCQRSVPVREAACPLCSKVESEGVQVMVVDEHGAHSAFLLETRVCFTPCHRPAIIFTFLNLSLTLTNCFSCLTLTIL